MSALPARLLPADAPDGLRAALTDALAGGRRWRAALALLVADAAGVAWGRALAVAVAAECLHAASLVLDDLPAFDGSATRRGRPSAHARHGEAAALLAATTLVAGGAAACPELGRAVAGMAAGEARDLAGVAPGDEAAVRSVFAGKTGALSAATARAAARACGLPPHEVATLARFGEALGIAYQAADDLSDAGSAARGLDAVAALGREAVERIRHEALAEARAALRLLGDRAAPLAALAEEVTGP